MKVTEIGNEKSRKHYSDDGYRREIVRNTKGMAERLLKRG